MDTTQGDKKISSLVLHTYILRVYVSVSYVQLVRNGALSLFDLSSSLPTVGSKKADPKTGFGSTHAPPAGGQVSVGVAVV